MHHDHTRPALPRPAPPGAALSLGERATEGLAACIGTVVGLVAAFAASPPAPLGLDVWMIGAPLYGAIVGLSLAVLRRGDGAAARTSGASTWKLGAVCAATWTAVAAVVVGT